MEIDKLYEVNKKNQPAGMVLITVFFLLIVLSSFLGLTFISFILTLFFAFTAYKFYIRFKRRISFVKLSHNNIISFLSSEKKIVIEDIVENFTFFTKRKNIFEIEHNNLKKNINLINDENVQKFLNHLEKQFNIKFKKPNKISFWEVIELIFMPS